MPVDPIPVLPLPLGQTIVCMAKNQMMFLVCCMKITYAENTWCWKMPSMRVSQEWKDSEATNTRFEF